jgi:hypothetical protein
VAGDFAGNGRTDLAIADYGNGFSNEVSVVLGNGDGTFQPPVNYAVGDGPLSIVSGDFTGDGHIDLAVADSGSSVYEPSIAAWVPLGDVSVLVGNGDGTFQPPVFYPVEGSPINLVSGGFTSDGRTDLAVTTWTEDGDRVAVLLGNGDGTFQPPVYYAAGAFPRGIVAGDFTGDGRTDLAVANGAGSGYVSVLLGNGDGTFQPPVTYAAGSQPWGIAAGDFTGDGRTDLAVTNNYGNDVSVLLGNGDGTFLPAVNYAVESAPRGIVAGDFTGDGRTDLAVTLDGANTVSVLLGNGDGTFQPAVQYAELGESSPEALVTGDFSGDGRTDLAVVDSGSATVSLYQGNGDGTFQTQATPATESAPITAGTGTAASDSGINASGQSPVANETATPTAPSTSPESPILTPIPTPGPSPTPTRLRPMKPHRMRPTPQAAPSIPLAR